MKTVQEASDTRQEAGEKGTGSVAKRRCLSPFSHSTISHSSPRRGRQTLARGVSPGSPRRFFLSPGGATQLLAIAVILTLAACSKPAPVNVEDDGGEEIPVKESQSNFLDLQVGVNWLSFVANAEREFPELFEGLDRDQKRRTRLAPATPADDRLLLEFSLPKSAKMWAVDWYETQLVAIDLPDARGFSVAIAPAKAAGVELADVLARNRADQVKGAKHQSGMGGTASVSLNGKPIAYYNKLILPGRTTSLVLVAEAWMNNEPLGDAHRDGVNTILAGVSIKRELSLEGLPKHKVSSALPVLLKGDLHFPAGSLSLPVKEGHLVRKLGGDSTVRVDGEGAAPWLLLRQLDQTSAPGDIRVRVRTDPVFSRRMKDPQASFSAGYDPGWNFPMVLWDYSNSGAEHMIMGVLVVGDELLSIEIISTGLRDAEARRKAKQAALDLLQGAHTAPIGNREQLDPLVGWNVGTMGKGG
ncbi:MAG: hypothetical protein IPK87_06640 [Planctomycetes bacterium]|nr:hypothetical protein [Planctomycetota bacterium]